MINSSEEAFLDPVKKNLIRWHFTSNKEDYFKLLTTFIKSYLKTTVRGKRSILKHFNKIGFEFDAYVDACFKTFMTHFIELTVSIELMMMFLIEG